jgi:hypothetical protein
VQKPVKHGRTGVFVPFRQYCCAHNFVAGSQLKEQIVLLAIHFLSWAQLPAGGAIFLADATETLAGNATVTASKATLTIDIIRMFIPLQGPISVT